MLRKRRVYSRTKGLWVQALRRSIVIPFLLKMRYIEIMDIAIEFNPSAFKHGITEAAIRYAIINAIFDDIWDDAADKHLLLGFDNNGSLLEIMYNVTDEYTVNVFHAMKCRSIYRKLIKD